MTISTAQIRGARGLLDWSQAELSRRTGISTTSIGNIESGNTQPRESTMGIIRRAFEDGGIEFIDGGIRKVQDVITVLEGEDCYTRLLDDVFHTLKDSDEMELLIANADDKMSPEVVNDSYRRIRNAGISMRQLVEDGNEYLMGELEEYRYLPKEYFLNRVTLTYGKKFAIVLENEHKISIINDGVLAEVQRKLFNLIWSFCERPAESVADERF